MKMRMIIAPVLALVAGGAWVATKHNAVTRLERKTEVLRERIADARRGGDRLPERRRETAPPRTKDEPEGIDWKELGESLAAAQQGGMPDMRKLMSLQQRLMKMEADELDAALAEVSALEDRPRQMLEGMLMNLLAQKEPKLVLDRFFDRIHDQRSGMGWQLAHAFGNWSAKEPAAAEAWLDERIAAGDFESRSLDGQSQSRQRFEAVLVSRLLATDPDAAGARLAALSEDQRAQLFNQGMFMNLQSGSERAFAELVREHVPEDGREAAFSQMTSSLVHRDGYEAVSGFIKEINASETERLAIASQAAQAQLTRSRHSGGVDRETVDEMRSWLVMETPEAASTITGEALGDLWGGDFEERVRLVEELHAEGGGDDLLVGFLNSHQARQQADEARRLAGLIEDAERRDAVMEAIERQHPSEQAPESVEVD